MTQSAIRETVAPLPEGRERWRWYGPGLLWMLSAVGTGSILFTPRVGSVYTYDLFWLLLIVTVFMWVMIREMARYTIVTGRTMLDGMNSLKGPKGWAVWLIFVPQLLAAAVGIAGLSAVVGSAFALRLPGGNTLYAELTLWSCVLLTTTGQYNRIERVSRYMAIVLMLVAVAAAVAVFPALPSLLEGLTFQWPDEPDLYVIAPWIGTILAGSMGIVWFSYWTATRGYGGGLTGRKEETDDEQPASTRPTRVKTAGPESQEHNDSARTAQLKSWLSIMSRAAGLGIVGGFVVITAFLILGAELLAPQGIVPEGTDVASDLTRLFSEVWGEPGRYLILLAIVVAIGGSVLANQDGWGRSFADMTLILSRDQRRRQRGWAYHVLRRLGRITGQSMLKRRNLKRLFIITVTGIVPAVIVLLFKDPVKVMSASGIIAAVHTPFIVITALLVNLLRLPRALRPNLLYVLLMAMAGLFYLGFAAVYFWSLGG